MSATRAHWFRWLSILGGFALLGVLFVRLGPERIVSLFRSMGPNLLIVIAIFGCHECVRALALSRCVLPDHRPPFRRLLWIRFFGEAVKTLTHTGPFVSEPARAWMLARQGLHGVHAYGAAVSEFVANSTASALVTVLVLGFVLRMFELNRQALVLAHVLVWISLAYMIATVVALVGRFYLIGAIVKGVGALPLIGRRLRVDPARVREMEDAIMLVLRDRPTTAATIVLLELTAQTIIVFELYWSLRSMQVGITVGKALLVEALTKLANTIQFVGATEGSYALVFSWLGMTAAVGFTLSLVKRLRSLVVAALGLLALSKFKG